jgi:histidinol-phosphatase
MDLDPDELNARLKVGLAAAREAGRLTLEYFQRDGLKIEWKADASPVTIADREAEKLLRERIIAEFEYDGILGEELPESPGASGCRWILDPIDGTKSFIHGVPLFGTLVGMEWRSREPLEARSPDPARFVAQSPARPIPSPSTTEPRSLLGIIYIPALDECLYAVRGGGAWHTRGAGAPRQVHVSAVSSLAESLFLTSEVASFGQRGAAAVYDRLQTACRLSRTWGDCYGYLMVATGRAELMVDPIMNVWDAAAVQPIIEEAGGTFTDWRGCPTIHAGEGLATNGHILAEALQVTAHAALPD